MKLELKHIKNYLDSEVEIYDKVSKTTFDMLQFITSHNQVKEFGFSGNLNQLLTDENLVMCLIPLSALIEPCLEGGKIPIVEILKMKHIESHIDRYNEVEIDGDGYPRCWFKYRANREFVIRPFEVREGMVDLWVAQKLFEWHFDVFGLIDSGLAIDKRTIKS